MLPLCHQLDLCTQPHAPKLSPKEQLASPVSVLGLATTPSTSRNVHCGSGGGRR